MDRAQVGAWAAEPPFGLRPDGFFCVKKVLTPARSPGGRAGQGVVGKRSAVDWDNEWREAVSVVTAAFESLPGATRKTLAELSRGMVAHKEAMQQLVAGVDAAAHCAGCGGACCRKGKYHFSAVDLLVYLAAGLPLFAPRFDNGQCPFLGEPECLIPPGCRPFNCITFNCELIEDQLAPDEVSRFYRMEQELVARYSEIRTLFPARSMDGPLLGITQRRSDHGYND